jgi:hypothetical protein
MNSTTTMNSAATFANRNEALPPFATATAAELAREAAEERRWNLEWDRRNVED